MVSLLTVVCCEDEQVADLDGPRPRRTGRAMLRVRAVGGIASRLSHAALLPLRQRNLQLRVVEDSLPSFEDQL